MSGEGPGPPTVVGLPPVALAKVVTGVNVGLTLKTGVENVLPLSGSVDCAEASNASSSNVTKTVRHNVSDGTIMKRIYEIKWWRGR